MSGDAGSPLVTVIVPVYNAETYLDDCVQSVLVQTHENWELILIDDGSTDRSGEICDRYSERDRRISVRHTDNRGVSHARNTGLDLAGGAWVAFLDSDDLLSPRALEAYLRSSGDVDVVVSASQTFPDGRVWRFDSRVRSFPSLSAMGSEFIPFLLSDRDTCWRKLFRKERLTVRFNERLRHHEDLYFFFEQLQRCRGIRVIPDILYFHRENHVDSLTHRFSTYGIQAGKDAYRYLLSVFPDSREVREFGLRYFVAGFICGYTRILSGADGIDERIKAVLLEETIRDPLYGEAGRNGIIPYGDTDPELWDAILRHDAEAALQCARRERAQDPGRSDGPGAARRGPIRGSL